MGKEGMKEEKNIKKEGRKERKKKEGRGGKKKKEGRKAKKEERALNYRERCKNTLWSVPLLASGSDK